MSQPIPFTQMFPDINIAAFRDAEILGVTVDKAHRVMDVRLRCGTIAPENGDVTALKSALLRSYGLSRADISFDGVQPVAEPDTPEEPEIKPEKTTASVKPVKKRVKVIMGKEPKNKSVPMCDLELEMGRATVRGRVFAVTSREIRAGKSWVLTFDMSDGTGAVRISKFMADAGAGKIVSAIKTGMYLAVSGNLTLNRHEGNDMTLDPLNIAEVAPPEPRHDTAEIKRAELHLHTKMSAMDAITDVDAVIKRAIEWGHEAIALTDHGVAHAFPDAYHAAHGKIRVLYGVEGYYINDMDGSPAAFGEIVDLPDEIVAFDLETTGLSAWNDRIIEIGAVTLKNGAVVSEFHTYVNPQIPVPAEITELTGITDADVHSAPDELTAVRAFLDYCGDRTLAAHNAGFDLGFIYEVCWKNGIAFDPACFDTVALARAYYPDLYNHKLPTVAAEMGIGGLEHHRALSDCTVTGHIAERFVEFLRVNNACTAREINAFVREQQKRRNERTRHIIIFARTQVGLKNLYKLITKSHLEHFSRNPIIPKSLLLEHRDGLLLGSACEAGEIFNAVERSSRFEQHRLARFYDYLEIQPTSNNAFMLRGDKPRAKDEAALQAFSRRVVELGRELGIPVCATCDAHFLDPEEEIYRGILLNAKGFEDALLPLPLYFRTTDEMLDEFAFLGKDTAYEIVVTNTREIASRFEDVRPLPPEKTLFPPVIEGSADTLKSLVYGKMSELYGDNPPEIITSRVETEMDAILGRGYDVIYIAAQKVVEDARVNGYHVGSRGSVGSSIVAFLSGITEVNALAAHYRCPACKYLDFDSGVGYGCGVDMPDADCPACGTKLVKDGFNIPFETFLGFGGTKVPDIDLNFSGEYQARAHRFATELFGAEHVFRAGTISKVAERTAYGYVKKYLDDTGRMVTRAEENRLASGCAGVKRTTGQHPGGLVVIPQDMEITDFCPVQRPADDTDSDIITMHFEYHSMEDNLLKLDLLGHDDPTMLKMLEDMTGVNALDIPLDDAKALAIFRSPEPLGIKDDEIVGATGTIGIPEFGTSFTREMLKDTQPKTFDTLVRLSGYSHGTGVWLGNARDIIMNNVADISETIGCREDFLQRLTGNGMDAKRAYDIVENVRKGRGLPDGAEDEMRSAGVPQWYIESCRKIQYLFPKAHAVAYVTMGVRIAWFKVHYPLEYYAAYFYRRSQKDAFDADSMTRGDETVKQRIREIRFTPDRERKQKETDLLTTLEACHEFYARGFTFATMDIYKSDALKFERTGDNALRPPLISVAGLGETAARDIAEHRSSLKFISVEEFTASCAKVTGAHVEQLRKLGALGDMPDTSQISLF